MTEFKGVPVSHGVVAGKIHIYHKGEYDVSKEFTEDTENEKKRYHKAVKEATVLMEELYESTLKEAGYEAADIFKAYEVMLEDEEYDVSICNYIDENKVVAEYAVMTVTREMASAFESIPDEYMQARADDIRAVADKVIDILKEENNTKNETGNEIAVNNQHTVLVADEITPTELMKFRRQGIAAFITKKGGMYSHVSILMRAMGIPSVADIPVGKLNAMDGMEVVVNGDRGLVVVEPDKNVFEQARAQYGRRIKKREKLQNLVGMKNETKDGRSIEIYANVSDMTDVTRALENDAGGIGLFRTEYMYLGRDTYPTEEEQFQVYKQMAQIMEDKPIVIRTLDAGSDKQARYFCLSAESNPAMGYRGIRISLDRRDMFKAQLRAILRAAAYGKIEVMFPMIVSLSEVRDIQGLLREARYELDERDMDYGDVKVGIMIETPAAAILSDILAKEVDFISIGTNDLTQYTLAVDRQNQKVAGVYDRYHPAVFKLIQQVVKNGHEAGCKVAICGELAADSACIDMFLNLGVDILSVPPDEILPIREAVINA